MRKLATAFFVFSLATTGCSVPEYEITDLAVDSGTVDSTTDATAEAPEDTGTPVVDSEPTFDISSDTMSGCTKNQDCLADPTGNRQCDLMTRKCVQCLPTPVDTCGTGQYCTADRLCVNGCKADKDCTGSGAVDGGVSVVKCVEHVCTGCKVDEDCPLGTLCGATDGICRPGCKDGRACQTGFDCCEGQCFDFKTDEDHCGGCTTKCPVGQPHQTSACIASVCQNTCDTNFGDCTGGPADGCETDLQNTATACGSCSKSCDFKNGTGKCETGVCKVLTCATGFDNCNVTGDDGCEQELNTLTHCAACNTACSNPNGVTDCSTGACTLVSCNTPFEKCGTVCKDTTSDPLACGGCTPHGPAAPRTPGGPGWTCGYSACTPGAFGNCVTGDTQCSTVLTDNNSHCGACGNACAAANGTATCSGTSCSIASCTSPFKSCNGATGVGYTDGCETSLTTATNCGDCNIPCAPLNAAGDCSSGACVAGACNDGFDDCVGATPGCETDIRNNPTHCGACNTPCAPTNGSGNCLNKVCTLSTCNNGFASCDSNLANGCETVLGSPPNSCATAVPILGSGTSPAGGFCGFKASQTVSVTSVGASGRFYKFTIYKCSGGSCNSGDPNRALVTMTSPSGVTYNLSVYSAVACDIPSRLGTQNAAGGASTSIQVRDNGCSTTGVTFYVEVKYVSGSYPVNSSAAACSGPTLTITSYNTPLQ